MKYAIINGHPDPKSGHLVAALADRYAEAAAAAGHEVRRIDVARMEFALLRDPQEFIGGTPPPAIRDAQADIAWANHLAIFYPLWMGDVPALFKAFMEQTFRPGFAADFGSKGGFPKKLLTGKTARIVVTMGMPAFAYRTMFGSHTLKGLALMMQMCGIEPVRETLIGGVGGASERSRRRWLQQMASIAICDGHVRKGATPVGAILRAAAAGAALGGAAYAASAAYAWARFGTEGKREPSLLDGVMPEYDVRVQHHVRIGAPADATFQAMCGMDFERSPIVQMLLRARELFMSGRHDGHPMAHGLLEQLEAIGWRIVAEEAGTELVFGAVTQPWQANPEFRGMSPETFRWFDTPGYAKIAVALRVDPLGTTASIARTETRVRTTDAESRTRFRRYWALVAPGIELIRIVLLQQLKAEAEGQRLGV